MTNFLKQDLTLKTASRMFWSIAVVYGTVWTFLPFWFELNFRYDIIEMFLIGKEGVIATFKHPMLNSALLEVVYQALRQSSIAPYLLSQLFFLATAWCVWRLGREVLPVREAIFGTLAFYGYWGYFYKSLYYNHNVILLAAWGFVTLFAFFALRNGRYRDWIALGIAIGVGVYCKLTILVLVVAILLFMSLNSNARKYWFRPGPYLTTLIALLIAVPLIDWMIRSDFSCLKYPAIANDLEKTWFNRFYALANDALFAPPLLAISFVVILFPLFGFRLRLRTLNQEQRWGRCFLLATHYLSWGLLALSCFTAVTPMDYRNYFPLLVFFGLCILLVFQTYQTSRRVQLTWLLVGLTMLGYVFGYSAHVYNSYYFSTRGIFYMFPGRQLAEEAEKIWHKKYHQPLPYVTGNWRLSGCVAIYGKDRPTFHGDYHGDYSGDYCNENLKGDRLRLSNWSTDQDVLKNGGLVFWNNGKDGESLPPPVQKRFPSAIVHPTAILLKQKIGKMKWSLVGVAVIPPDSSVKTQPFHPAPKRFYLPKK